VGGTSVQTFQLPYCGLAEFYSKYQSQSQVSRGTEGAGGPYSRPLDFWLVRGQEGTLHAVPTPSLLSCLVVFSSLVVVVLDRQSEAAVVTSSAQRDWYIRFMTAANFLEKAGLPHPLSIGCRLEIVCTQACALECHQCELDTRFSAWLGILAGVMS
jgi:hypothetical protein